MLYCGLESYWFISEIAEVNDTADIYYYDLCTLKRDFGPLKRGEHFVLIKIDLGRMKIVFFKYDNFKPYYSANFCFNIIDE